jgi:hypothetical protein
MNAILNLVFSRVGHVVRKIGLPQYTVRSESRRAIIKGIGGDIHEK